MKRILLVIVAGGITASFVLAGLHWALVQHWAAIHTGTLNESGPYYGFWSGFGSDLGEATLITAVCVGAYTGVRKVNCHTKGCWRIGHYALEGTPYKLCKIHHPEVPDEGPSHEHILAHHKSVRR